MQAVRDPVVRWLWAVWAMVLLMVAIGGITRLTGSGLSMVDWHPLMGALPPMSEDAWLRVFERYKSSPQYQQVNHWMQLADFKRIFFWEYFHRLFGRLIGLVFFVPFAYFAMRGRLRGAAFGKALLALVLGGSQGLLGWYMVKSGLVDEPRVSHLRLAAHLLLAFSVGGYLVWFALDLSARPVTAARPDLRVWAWVFLGLCALQVVFGAFMAGTHAGQLFSSFPDMGGAYGPARFFRFDGLADNLINNPLAIHWTHRALAWLVLVVGLGGSRALLRRYRPGPVRAAAYLVLAALAAQFLLGALTVVFGVPLTLAVAHQVGGFVLLSTAVALLHRLSGRGQVV